MGLFSFSSTLLRRFDQWATPVLGAVGVGVFIYETVRPLRRRTRPRLERWPVNVGLALPSLVGLRLLLLPGMVGLTQLAEMRRWGLLHRLALPAPVRALAELLLLDYVAYSWHRLLHAPLLWRFHRVHHNDLDMDLTTGWRFHAGEMVASLPYRGGVPALLGVRASTLLAYEVAFEACTAFHHSNAGLPIAAERRLAPLLVTPRVHGIHHSVVHRETQSNYGVVLTLWDRLHRTMRFNVPQQDITIGVPAYPNPAELGLGHLLRMPLAPLQPWTNLDGSVPDRAPQPMPPGELAE